MTKQEGGEQKEVKRMTKRKVMKFISSTISTLLIIVLVGMTFLVISARASGGEPQLFGYQVKTVLSGSMSPEFETGSIILVEKLKQTENLQKGDVITFKENSDHLVTHRIVEVVQQGDAVQYRTKGDNNEAPDMNLVLPDNVVAQYTGFTIPYVGYLLSYAGSPMGVAVLLIVPGLFLLGYSIITIRQAVKAVEEKAKSGSLSEEEKPIS
ncbi:signal peptidase I SipW [Virgibacillus siamensis]|uniref:signal peptidase I SipW n=1 Tax=Virgibacillus siamensis TaxID=480071 RepID=UPI001FE77601|nr:signal peptidase I [Virgibacillus siamensis]